MPLTPSDKTNIFIDRKDPIEESRMLVQKLSVADARRLMKLEGVELDGKSFIRELVFTVAFAAATAYAIVTGGVTVWHLFMPLIACWFALVTAIPVVYLFYRHDAIKVEAKKSIYNLLFLAAVIATAVAIHAGKTKQPFSIQFQEDVHTAWRWVIDSDIHWAMIIAYFNIVSSMPARVHNLMEFGPPFAAVGIGCATQLLVFFAGACALPVIIEKQVSAVWVMWFLLNAAHVLALWVHWDVGWRLKKYDAERLARNSK